MLSRRALFGLLLSLGLLYLFFRPVDWGALVAALFEANLLLLAPALTLYFAGVWLRSVRWRLLLAPVADVPTSRLFRALIIGFTANDLLPVRLGEVARAVLLGRWNGVRIGVTLATIVVERLLDGLTLCAFLAVGWTLVPLKGLEHVAWVGAALFLALVVAFWVAAVWPGRALSLLERLVGRAPARVRDPALRLAQSFVAGLEVVRRGRLLAAALLLSLGAWLLEAGMYFAIMLGFGLQLPLVAALLGTAAANLVTLVPSSPGYLGTFDVALQRVLVDLFGTELEVATSYTLLVHAALIVPVVALGMALLWRSELSLNDLRVFAERVPGRGAAPSGASLPNPRLGPSGRE